MLQEGAHFPPSLTFSTPVVPELHPPFSSILHIHPLERAEASSSVCSVLGCCQLSMSERFLGELKITEFIFEENDCHGPLTESLLLSNKSFGTCRSTGISLLHIAKLWTQFQGRRDKSRCFFLTAAEMDF